MHLTKTNLSQYSGAVVSLKQQSTLQCVSSPLFLPRCSVTGINHPGHVPPMPASLATRGGPINCKKAHWLLSRVDYPRRTQFCLFLHLTAWPMVLAPLVKSSLNALVDCISHRFAQGGQGHVQICVSHPASPFSDCWGHASVYDVIFVWTPRLFIHPDVVS